MKVSDGDKGKAYLYPGVLVMGSIYVMKYRFYKEYHMGCKKKRPCESHPDLAEELCPYVFQLCRAGQPLPGNMHIQGTTPTSHPYSPRGSFCQGATRQSMKAQRGNRPYNHVIILNETEQHDELNTFRLPETLQRHPYLCIHLRLIKHSN